MRRAGPVQVGSVGLAAEAVIEAATDQQHQHRATGHRDGEQQFAVGVGVHRQTHWVAELQTLRGAHRDVHGDALGDVQFDRYPQRQIARRHLLFADVGHGHAGWYVELQPHPDRDGQVVAKRQRQRAALGGQGVGVAGVDDGDRPEEVLDGGRDHCEPLAGNVIAGGGRLGLTQRPQHVLPKWGGVLQAGQAGAGVGAQRRGQAPLPQRRRPDRVDDVVVDPAGDVGGKVGWRLFAVSVGVPGQPGLRDQGGQWPGRGQAGPQGVGQRAEHRAGVIGLRAPLQRRQQDLAARFVVAGQRAPQHRRDGVLAAGDGGVGVDGHGQCVIEVGRHGRVGAHPCQRCTDGGVEGGQHHRAGEPPDGEVGGDRRGALGVGGGDRDGRLHRLQQVGRRRGQRPVAQDGGAAGGGDAQDPVDDLGAAGRRSTQRRVVDPVQRPQVGLGVGGGDHAHPAGRSAQPIQPGRRGGLPGAGAGGRTESVGRLGHHVAVGHCVDRDQQVGVHRETQGAVHAGAGVDGPGAGGELCRAQQGVEAAAGSQRDRQVVVHQSHRFGTARQPGCQTWLVGQRPQHGHRHRFGGVGGHRVIEGVAGGGRRVGRDAGYRQQETRLVEACGVPVVGCAVDVDQNRIHTGVFDTQCRPLRRAHRHREAEPGGLSTVEFGCHSDEFTHRVELTVGVQGGAQRRGVLHRRAALQAGHHVAYRSIPDVGDRSGHGDGGFA